jgi:hypothetical protein
MLDDIRFIFYTNESNFGLGELCVKHFLMHNKREDLKVSLISNNFPHDNFQFDDRVTYLNANVERKSDGSHFAQTMLSVLPEIKEKYVFYFCDDYFFVKETKYDDLREVLNMMDCDSIDYFGLDDIGEFKPIREYDKYVSLCENKYKDHFYLRERDYRYLFSVQPCIWNTNSLHELLKVHNNISLHDLDETLDVIKTGNTYKALCNDLPSGVNFHDVDNTDYFLIAYHELVRHGVFWIPENGQALHPLTPSVQFTYKLIDDEDLTNRPDFKNILFQYKK